MPLPEDPQPDPKASGKPASRRKKPQHAGLDYATCGQCRHWVAGDDDPAEGMCYRLPPVVHTNDDEFWTVRPPVSRDERGCGEFKGAM